MSWPAKKTAVIPLPDFTKTRRTAYLAFIAIIVVLTLWLAVNTAWKYFLSLHFADHAEPSAAIQSWIFSRGGPLYPGLSGGSGPSLPYGPVYFMIEAFFLRLFGPSVISAKILGVGSYTAALVILLYFFRKLFKLPLALLFLSLSVMLIHHFGYAAVWSRSDSAIALCVVIATHLLFLPKSKTSWLWIGVVAGVATGMKVQALLFFLPHFAYLLQKRGLSDCVSTFVVSIILPLLPFLLPNADLKAYFELLVVVASHGYDKKAFMVVADFTFFLLIPFMLSAGLLYINDRSVFRKEVGRLWLFWISIPACVLMSAILSCKDGAGIYYMYPPTLLVVMAQAVLVGKLKPLFRGRRWLAVIVMTAVIVSFNARAWYGGYGIGRDFLKYIDDIYPDDQFVEGVFGEYREIVARYPGKRIEAGYAGIDTYWMTWCRQELAFMTGMPGLDLPAVMEITSYDGKPVRELENLLKNCNVGVWVLPKNDTPFSILSWYHSAQLFSREFRDLFIKNYKPMFSTPHFDAWVCSGGSGS